MHRSQSLAVLTGQSLFRLYLYSSFHTRKCNTKCCTKNKCNKERNIAPPTHLQETDCHSVQNSKIKNENWGNSFINNETPETEIKGVKWQTKVKQNYTASHKKVCKMKQIDNKCAIIMILCLHSTFQAWAPRASQIQNKNNKCIWNRKLSLRKLISNNNNKNRIKCYKMII